MMEPESDQPATDANGFHHALTANDGPVGVIAGNGRLPFLVADGIHARGGVVCAVGLKGSCSPDLAQCCDQFQIAGIARIGKWIRTLKKWGVQEVVMVGGVDHGRKYARFQFLHYVPDWRAASLWYRSLRHDRRTATMLTALADELSRNGVTLIDTRTYIPEHLASLGAMNAIKISESVAEDVDFAWDLLTKSVELNVGQSLAVRSRDVIAVEAAEGTNAMIERAGQLCKGRPWVFAKTSSQNHDMRADVPTIGVETIDRLEAAGAVAMVVGAERVIMVDKLDVIRRADELRIAIIGRSI